MNHCNKGCQYAKDVGMEDYSCKKRCVYAETKPPHPVKGHEESFEVPVHTNKHSPVAYK